jgi:DsbC/DsbD-like thiol-disulfide interchange protein
VQSNKPRDQSLIPTVLTIDAPAGVTVDAVHYPKPTDLAQPNRKDPLAVYGSEFEIGVKVSLGPNVAAGDLVLPATLRYQACNETVCFPPARAAAQWTLSVSKD